MIIRTGQSRAALTTEDPARRGELTQEAVEGSPPMDGA